MTERADLVLVSDSLFTGLADKPEPGYVAVSGNVITSVGPKEEADAWIGPDTVVRDFGGALITAGFHDNHTFFTGSVLITLGLDLSGCGSWEEALESVKTYAAGLPEGSDIYGHGWPGEAWGEEPPQAPLDEVFPGRAVALFNAERSYCWMNAKAMEKYRFTPDACHPEAVAELLRELASDKEQMARKFTDFGAMLAKRGVTSIKDIAFDDYLGMLDILESLEKEGRLGVRVNFCSQPNSRPIDFAFGERCTADYQGDFLRFQGYKLMTDGIIADFTGDLLEPYANDAATTNRKPVDYGKVRQAALEADRRSFKVCIHAEGDAAVRQAVGILEECREQSGTKLRHSIANLELTHPDDLQRMGQADIVAEVYSQILLMNDSEESAYMREFAGEEREGNFYNYGTMRREGVVVTMGTDLPLMYPSVPDSLYAVTARKFADGSPEGGWHKENGLSMAEVLKAWTISGAYHNGLEDKTGTLEPGKYADIAVLNRDLFQTPEEEWRDAKVIFTLLHGRIVHDKG
ncbi:hypothetical protein DFP94_10764 [Fontibacillus phaseoli]|uniref:Amidohydrolase 3 domain-containing protein n=1 Tax=Fontibacillus phaseoli TaxID=1416533 RepID=A0A369B9B3_9BACL|nr:amidohydrolase family protein [Fontibacillus phaseoli]RCX18110.1 hypothetical protein DFP94_10764 [Fontibacillus phaseoli]